MKKLLAALAAFFVLLTPLAARADRFAGVDLSPGVIVAMDRTQHLTGLNPPSTWMNQEQRDVRLGFGAALWMMLAGSSTSYTGTFSNCTIAPVTGLYVAVGPTSTNTLCGVYQLLAEETSGYGGYPSGVGTYLAADPTKVILQGLLSANTANIGPLNPPGTSGQSIDYLIECQVQISDTTSQTVNIVSSGGSVTATAANRDRVDRPVCQSKAGTAATTGTQVPPTVDTGYVSIGYVAVAYGTVTITTGMVTGGTPFYGFAPLSASGATAIDTSANGQTKIGGFVSSAGYIASGAISSALAAGELSTALTSNTGYVVFGSSNTSYGIFGFTNAHAATVQSGDSVATTLSTSGGYVAAGGNVSTTQVGWENDGAVVNGMLFNVPTGSTNGYSFNVAGVNVAQITAAGGFVANAGGTGLKVVGTSPLVYVGVSGTATSNGGYEMGNATSSTQLDNNTSNSISTINCGLLGVVLLGTGVQACFDTSGNIGINGTVHAVSSRKHKRDIHPFSDEQALAIVRQTSLVTFCYKQEPQSNCSPHGGVPFHIGFIAEDTPTALAGNEHNQVEPVSFAAVAFGAAGALDQHLTVYEKSHDLEVAALWNQIRFLYILLGLVVIYLLADRFMRR